MTHLNLTDSQFEKQFRDLKLDPRLFNHEAHLRLAWIHLKKHGEIKAIENIRKQIRSFASHNGEPDKYHETLTVAAVKAVNHFIKASDSNSFETFIKSNGRLIVQFKSIIGSHYSQGLLFSETAKSTFLEPDKEQF